MVGAMTEFIVFADGQDKLDGISPKPFSTVRYACVHHRLLHPPLVSPLAGMASISQEHRSEYIYRCLSSPRCLGPVDAPQMCRYTDQCPFGQGIGQLRDDCQLL